MSDKTVPQDDESTTVPFTTPEILALEAQIAAQRVQLAATVDEVAARLDPRTQAQAAAASAQRLLHDARSEDAAPADRDRARKILAGAAAGVVLVVALAIARARRH